MDGAGLGRGAGALSGFDLGAARGATVVVESDTGDLAVGEGLITPNSAKKSAPSNPGSSDSIRYTIPYSTCRKAWAALALMNFLRTGACSPFQIKIRLAFSSTTRNTLSSFKSAYDEIVVGSKLPSSVTVNFLTLSEEPLLITTHGNPNADIILIGVSNADIILIDVNPYRCYELRGETLNSFLNSIRTLRSEQP